MFPMGGSPAGAPGPQQAVGMAMQGARDGANTRLDVAGGKESPQEANLREATSPAQSCGTCMAFDGMNQCAKVAGKVSPAQTCDEWSSGDGKQEMAEGEAPGMS